MDKKDNLDHSIKTEFYSLRMRPAYALIIYYGINPISAQALKEIKNHLKHYYSKRNFILINRRSGHHGIDPSFYKLPLKNMQGVAVVSKKIDLREQLLAEQKIWKRSFAYFRSLSDARKWAQDCFEYLPQS